MQTKLVLFLEHLEPEDRNFENVQPCRESHTH